MAPQYVIEISGLPFELAIGDAGFESFDPGAERDRGKPGSREHMQVIGHEDVTPGPPIVMRGAFEEELAHARVDRVASENRPPVERAEGEKIHRLPVVQPDALEAALALWVIFHRVRCAVAL